MFNRGNTPSNLTNQSMIVDTPPTVSKTRFGRNLNATDSSKKSEPIQQTQSDEPTKKFGFSFLNKKKEPLQEQITNQDETLNMQKSESQQNLRSQSRVPTQKLNLLPPNKSSLSQSSIKYTGKFNNTQISINPPTNQNKDGEVFDKIREIVTDYLSPNDIRSKPLEDPKRKFGAKQNDTLQVPHQQKPEKDQDVLDKIKELVTDYLYTKPIKPKKFGFSFLYDKKEIIQPPVVIPQIVIPIPPSPKRKYVLDRVIDDLTEYLATVTPEKLKDDALKIQEINDLMDRIQGHMKPPVKVIEPVIEKVIEQPVPQLDSYSNVLQDDSKVHNMLSEILDYDDYDDNLKQSLLKRKAYIDSKLKPKNLSEVYYHSDRFPPQQTNPIQNNFYPLLGKVKSDPFTKSNLVAERYGIKLELPVMQDFVKTRKMTPNIFNFLMFFLQQKADHQRQYNDGYKYGTSIKLFPLQFYLALTNNLISNTYRIEYMDASRFTFEHTGLDQTIFNLYDWVVVPIMELPCEYSIVIGNLSSRTLYCFQLSSLGLRISDPAYANPDKNPYLKNVQSFLHREFEIKCSRARMDLGNYTMVFGRINKDPNFNHKMRYEDSGLYAVYIIIHLLKFGNVDGISIDEGQMQTLCKALHDLIVRIGYNVDENIYYILDENKWPF